MTIKDDTAVAKIYREIEKIMQAAKVPELHQQHMFYLINELQRL